MMDLDFTMQGYLRDIRKAFRTSYLETRFNTCIHKKIGHLSMSVYYGI